MGRKRSNAGLLERSDDTDEGTSEDQASSEEVINRFEPRWTRSKTYGSSFKDVQVVQKEPELWTSSRKTSQQELLKRGKSCGDLRASAETEDTNLREKRIFVSCNFILPAIDKQEARRRWAHRYPSTDPDVPKDEAENMDKGRVLEGNRNLEELELINHYTEANVDGNLLRLNDCVHVNPDNCTSKKDYVARLIELYKNPDKTSWCRLQWFYRAEDTSLAKDGSLVDDAGELPENMLFCSTFESDELLECLLNKAEVIHLKLVPSGNQEWNISEGKYYYVMGYNEEYSTFYAVSADKQKRARSGANDLEHLMLDLYSGCGGMSTGLCAGALLGAVKLKTQWAVDINKRSCESILFNHPETEVHNYASENFLLLIKKWDDLCKMYPIDSIPLLVISEEDDTLDKENEEYEVEDILGIRWSNTVDITSTTTGHVEFKVKWKGYSNPEDETWEPEQNLEHCPDILRDFILSARSRKILPRPGECDVICGGPPCQGVSGMNKYRDTENPLGCEKNRQVIVYMDFVEFLKPRFMLMENVVDILRFANGVVGRYALTRLVQMKYQARLGLMAAGRYGVPQYRQRMFLWGAAEDEVLPSFPLPTHRVENVRTSVPTIWKKNVVEEEEPRAELQQHITLKDALTDLPPIDNFEKREEMEYLTPPSNSFQRMVRRHRHESGIECRSDVMKLLDHLPHELFGDDLERTKLIPKKKGACFRDLPGMKVLPDGTVDVERRNRRTCKSGKPLVPNYTLTLNGKKNTKSFGRVWWDETIGTVYTTVLPHRQRMLHPDQDRTLSVRECARVQGFPDYYKFCGTVCHRYAQVGNAVSVPTARALGYCLGRALCFNQDPSSEDTGKAVINLPAAFTSC